jgi:ferredoxin
VLANFGNETTMIVRILRAECCGNGTCAELVPAVFVIDSNHKSVVIDAEAADRAKLLEAAEACPCSAIVIEDDEGNAVFP